MAPMLAPIKTPAGQDELTHRTRRLSQRHRTVLLLVDGRRPLVQIQQLAAKAGVPEGCLDELVSLGLVALPEAAPLVDDGVAHVELPLSGFPASALADPVVANEAVQASVAPSVSDSHPSVDESLLPAAGSLLPESGWMALETAEGVDRPMEEAREILMRALRNEAPVSGSLTMLKLKRASTRGELEELLDEVEQRIRKPRKMIVTAQTLRHVRHLLSLPAPVSAGAVKA